MGLEASILTCDWLGEKMLKPRRAIGPEAWAMLRIFNRYPELIRTFRLASQVGRLLERLSISERPWSFALYAPEQVSLVLEQEQITSGHVRIRPHRLQGRGSRPPAIARQGFLARDITRSLIAQQDLPARDIISSFSRELGEPIESRPSTTALLSKPLHQFSQTYDVGRYDLTSDFIGGSPQYPAKFVDGTGDVKASYPTRIEALQLRHLPTKHIGPIISNQMTLTYALEQLRPSRPWRIALETGQDLPLVSVFAPVSEEKSPRPEIQLQEGPKKVSTVRSKKQRVQTSSETPGLEKYKKGPREESRSFERSSARRKHGPEVALEKALDQKGPIDTAHAERLTRKVITTKPETSFGSPFAMTPAVKRSRYGQPMEVLSPSESALSRMGLALTGLLMPEGGVRPSETLFGYQGFLQQELVNLHVREQLPTRSSIAHIASRKASGIRLQHHVSKPTKGPPAPESRIEQGLRPQSVLFKTVTTQWPYERIPSPTEGPSARGALPLGAPAVQPGRPVTHSGPMQQGIEVLTSSKPFLSARLRDPRSASIIGPKSPLYLATGMLPLETSGFSRETSKPLLLQEGIGRSMGSAFESLPFTEEMTLISLFEAAPDIAGEPEARPYIRPFRPGSRVTGYRPELSASPQYGLTRAPVPRFLTSGKPVRGFDRASEGGLQVLLTKRDQVRNVRLPRRDYSPSILGPLSKSHDLRRLAAPQRPAYAEQRALATRGTPGGIASTDVTHPSFVPDDLGLLEPVRAPVTRAYLQELGLLGPELVLIEVSRRLEPLSALEIPLSLEHDFALRWGRQMRDLAAASVVPGGSLLFTEPKTPFAPTIQGLEENRGASSFARLREGLKTAGLERLLLTLGLDFSETPQFAVGGATSLTAKTSSKKVSNTLSEGITQFVSRLFMSNAVLKKTLELTTPEEGVTPKREVVFTASSDGDIEFVRPVTTSETRVRPSPGRPVTPGLPSGEAVSDIEFVKPFTPSKSVVSPFTENVFSQATRLAPVQRGSLPLVTPHVVVTPTPMMSRREEQRPAPAKSASQQQQKVETGPVLDLEALAAEMADRIARRLKRDKERRGFYG